MQAADDPTVNERMRTQAILMIYFGQPSIKGGHRCIALPDEVLADPDGALSAALNFLNLGEPKRPQSTAGQPRSKARTWDWDHDSPRVISDFQREYNVDLTEVALSMHWWRFWSLFRGLSDASLTMTAMATRGADPQELRGEDKTRLIARQRALALPARTEEEALRLTSLLWGLDV